MTNYIDMFGGDANPNESTKFENLVSGGSSSKGSSGSNSSLLSNIGNVFNFGNDSKDTEQKIQEIANIAEEGTNIVEDLRKKNAGGSLSEILDTVNKIADDEAEHDKQIGDYGAAALAGAGTGASIAGTIGSAFPVLGNAIGGGVGSVVGAVGGLAKTLIQDLGGPTSVEQSEKVEKEIAKKLKQAGIEIPSDVNEKKLHSGYGHDEKEKAQDTAKIIALAEDLGAPAANFFTKKLKKTDRKQPIQPGEPKEWAKEYMNIRSGLELSIERMHTALTKITRKPERSKERTKDAYDKLVEIHRKYPHPEYKQAADKLLKKVKAAYKKQTNRMFGMTPDTQKKFFLYGGAAFVAIAVIVIIIILMQKEN